MRSLAFPVPSGFYVRLERSYCTALAWRNGQKHDKYRFYGCHSGPPSKVSRTRNVLLRNMALFFCFAPGTWWSTTSGRKSHGSNVATGRAFPTTTQHTASVLSPLCRTIWLLLDSVHRQVQWLRLAPSDGPNWVGLPCPIHLRTETDPVSETLWSFVKLPHSRRWTESKRSQIILYNIHHRQNLFKSICA
jgi:hypothetical protein